MARRRSARGHTCRELAPTLAPAPSAVCAISHRTPLSLGDTPRSHGDRMEIPRLRVHTHGLWPASGLEVSGPPARSASRHVRWRCAIAHILSPSTESRERSADILTLHMLRATRLTRLTPRASRLSRLLTLSLAIGTLLSQCTHAPRCGTRHARLCSAGDDGGLDLARWRVQRRGGVARPPSTLG